MTAPEMVEVVAGVIADNSVVIHEHSDYGELTASTLTPDEMARAVLAALTEAGTVQFGVRWHVGGCGGINRCTSKRHAERQAAKLIESGHEATVVSRLTLPWTKAVE